MTATSETTILALTPLLVDAKNTARILGISRRLLYLMQAARELGPSPVKIHRRRLWRVSELQRWTEAGCPSREIWGLMEQDAKKRRTV